MATRTYLGEDAQALLSHGEFDAQWRRLLANCTWSTFFQHPDFVQTWFDHYSKNFAPFVATDIDSTGELKNLLVLAIDQVAGVAVPPGDDQSEYQCWLSDGETDPDFLSGALRELANATGQGRITFKFVPPDLTFRLERLLRAMAVPNQVRKEPTPIISLNVDPPPWKSLQKKSNKSRLSRMQKLGPVEVEYNHGAFGNMATWSQEFMDAIAPMYDLRQGAISDVKPFTEDPAKLKFHVALLSQSKYFRSITLRVGDEIVAGVAGPCWNQTFSVAIIAYSPFVARHSPGKFLLLQGAKVLKESGINEIDLTPGGAWKERFSNSSRQVCQLTFHLARSSFVAARVGERGRSTAKSLLKTAGLTPADTRTFFAKLQKATPAQAWRRTRKSLWARSPREFRVYAYSARRARLLGQHQPQHRPKVNSIADFLCFAPTELWQSHSAFLKSVLGRFEAGERGYTYVEQGILLHNGWLVPRQTESYFTEVGKKYSYPKHTAILYDFYTHPDARGRGIYQSTMRQMLVDAADDPETEWVYISVLADNRPSRHVIEKVGFEYVESLYG